MSTMLTCDGPARRGAVREERRGGAAAVAADGPAQQALRLRCGVRTAARPRTARGAVGTRARAAARVRCALRVRDAVHMRRTTPRPVTEARKPVRRPSGARQGCMPHRARRWRRVSEIHRASARCLPLNPLRDLLAAPHRPGARTAAPCRRPCRRPSSHRRASWRPPSSCLPSRRRRGEQRANCTGARYRGCREGGDASEDDRR